MYNKYCSSFASRWLGAACLSVCTECFLTHIHDDENTEIAFSSHGVSIHGVQ